ncbi:hypothetical protein BR93DRAFT_961595 [Coniochaeta sp. PMI_546]|nr:hypothetical protein BR93DRAFT_961595 [Coniochaeta sp. PMI_546]
MPLTGKVRYAAVSARDSNDDGPFLADGDTHQRRLGSLLLRPLVPWTLTAVFASLSLFLAILIDRKPSDGLGSFASGYATDFGPAKNYIHVSQQRFTGGASFDEDGMMLIPNMGETRFIGDPKVYPEIDHNWDNLTWGRYVLITKEEAIEAWGKEYATQEYWDTKRGGYLAGFDMFHTLHCLNHIRKSLNPSYYGTVYEFANGKYGGHPEVHQDHCIDHIRQFIMCSGDMTPVPTKYYPGLGRNYVESEMPHTCRNFDALRDWMVDRFQGDSAIQPQ